MVPETLGLRMWAKRIQARPGEGGGDGGAGAQARRDPCGARTPWPRWCGGGAASTIPTRSPAPATNVPERGRLAGRVPGRVAAPGLRRGSALPGSGRAGSAGSVGLAAW